MIELILVRHGETDSNKRGTYLGWTDIELNEEGIRQAYCAKGKLEGVRVDGVFASPLRRAARTAEIINENFNVDICYMDELKERNFGIWDDLTYKEICERYPKEHGLWVNDWVNYRLEGGESAVEAYKRVTGFIDRIINDNESGVYLVVTHLGCIRNILAHLLGLGIQGVWHFRLNNCGITKVEINAEKYAFLTMLNG
ncbi:MAG: alpha-ribazole phosphatase [Clostridia bacterium]|nr:alpha-ribazole phosphatase [Clostridia bacterium]